MIGKMNVNEPGQGDGELRHRPSTSNEIGPGLVGSVCHPLSRSSTQRIYEVLWRTEMFQDRGALLKMHVLEFDGRNTDEESVDLEEALWSELSRDLVRRVLVQLPLVEQCRFRVVSKGLRSALPEASSICVYESSSSLSREPQQQRESQSGYVSRILGILGLFSRNEQSARRVSELREVCFRSDRGAEEYARRLRDEFQWHQRKVHRMTLTFAPSWMACTRCRASRDGILYTFVHDTAITEEPAHSVGRLCLLNPFTRTCTVLPNLPKLNEARTAWYEGCEVVVDDKRQSEFFVYLIVSTAHRSGTDQIEWFICKYSSASASKEWTVVSGDSSSSFKHESLFFSRSKLLLYSWNDKNLSTHDLNTGKLTETVEPKNTAVLPEGYELLELDRTEIVEFKGVIYAAMSMEVRLSDGGPPGGATQTVIGISELGPDLRWGEARIMPEAALHKYNKREVNEREMADRLWLFLDYTVVLLGDRMCFKILKGFMHGEMGGASSLSLLLDFTFPPRPGLHSTCTCLICLARQIWKCFSPNACTFTFDS